MTHNTLLIASLFFAVFSWKVFEWFSWSRSKSYRSSRWQYYKSKIGFSVTAFILFLIAGEFIISTKSDTHSNAVERKAEMPVEREKRNNDSNSFSVGNNKFNEVMVVPSTHPSKDIKEYTDDEIFELEEKAQYHGDDPIVRSRLGLPPARK